MTKGKTKISVEIDDDLLDRMEAKIDRSIAHENRSQFVRTAIRALLAEEDDEFGSAR